MILSVTFVPAAIALFLRGKVGEKESPAVAWAQEGLYTCARCCHAQQGAYRHAAVVIVVLSGLLTTRMGSEFVPSLNEGDIALHAMRIPGTSLTTAVEMQDELEKTIKAFRRSGQVFSKIGTAEIATDPMPPSVADIFVILKPPSEWPVRTTPKLSWWLR